MHWLDIVILILIVILGAQGIMRGAIRELSSLFGIGLGIFLGSRLALAVGRWASAHSFQFSSEGAMKLAGFALIFLIVWGICFLLGLWLSKRLRRKESMTRAVAIWADRVLGFIIGAGKIYIIFAAIVFALNQTEAISKWSDNNLGDSFLYPPLKATGGFLIKLDKEARNLIEDAEAKAEEIKEAIKEGVEVIEPTVSEIIDSSEETAQALSDGVETVKEAARAIGGETQPPADQTAPQTPNAETQTAQALEDNETQTVQQTAQARTTNEGETEQ
ncbi:MAG: CvpA family protein [Helicobacteraceae bacterium]|jgi:membrane protein required for colicin V production|nr:CvpA family protein [Helicobacteraceae bacterium]